MICCQPCLEARDLRLRPKDEHWRQHPTHRVPQARLVWIEDFLVRGEDGCLVGKRTTYSTASQPHLDPLSVYLCESVFSTLPTSSPLFGCSFFYGLSLLRLEISLPRVLVPIFTKSFITRNSALSNNDILYTLFLGSPVQARASANTRGKNINVRTGIRIRIYVR